MKKLLIITSVLVFAGSAYANTSVKTDNDLRSADYKRTKLTTGSQENKEILNCEVNDTDCLANNEKINQDTANRHHLKSTSKSNKLGTSNTTNSKSTNTGTYPTSATGIYPTAKPAKSGSPTNSTTNSSTDTNSGTGSNSGSSSR